MESRVFDVYQIISPLERELHHDPDIEFKYKPGVDYSEIESKGNALVILPTFTASAYKPDAFYAYFHNTCDTLCLTTQYSDSLNLYDSNKLTAQLLHLLGYYSMTDLEVHQYPHVLNEFDTLILLHNEYVTKTEYDAIQRHSNVIHLFPNSLFAEVYYDKEDDSITLVRGHGYPDPAINNGFDWEFDVTPLEFDIKCNDWNFRNITNGYQLNCYPEQMLFNNYDMLKFIADKSIPT